MPVHPLWRVLFYCILFFGKGASTTSLRQFTWAPFYCCKRQGKWCYSPSVKNKAHLKHEVAICEGLSFSLIKSLQGSSELCSLNTPFHSEGNPTSQSPNSPSISVSLSICYLGGKHGCIQEQLVNHDRQKHLYTLMEADFWTMSLHFQWELANLFSFTEVYLELAVFSKLLLSKYNHVWLVIRKTRFRIYKEKFCFLFGC